MPLFSQGLMEKKRERKGKEPRTNPKENSTKSTGVQP